MHQRSASHRSLPTSVSGLALLALLALVAAALPTRADAQTPDTFAFSAEAAAVDLSLFGTAVATLADTATTADDTAGARADAAAARLADDSATVAQTSASATTRATSDRDPDSGGNACGVPGLPAELEALDDVLALAEVCSSSTAAVADTGAPTAIADASSGGLTVNGQVLAELIFDILLAPVLDVLDTAVEQIMTTVIAPVDAALAEVCAELPPELTPAALVAAAEDAGLPIRDIITALPDGQTLYDSLGDDCLLSLTALLELAGVIVNYVEDQVRTLLTTALDRDFLSLSLGGASSSITTSGGVLRVVGRAEAISLTSPSLQFLVDVVRDHVVAILDQAIDDVTAVVPTQLADVVAVIPEVGDVVDQILGQLPLDDLVDDQPLLSLSVSESLAVAAYRGPGDVDTGDSATGTVTLAISPAIAALLGIPAETTVVAGQDVVIGEDTPLVSRIVVGGVEQLSDTAGASNVAVTGARASGISLQLLTDVEGGIVAEVAAAQALAGGTIDPTTPPRSLPATGSSSMPALLIGGLLALVALASWRRLNR